MARDSSARCAAPYIGAHPLHSCAQGQGTRVVACLHGLTLVWAIMHRPLQPACILAVNSNVLFIAARRSTLLIGNYMDQGPGLGLCTPDSSSHPPMSSA